MTRQLETMKMSLDKAIANGQLSQQQADLLFRSKVTEADQNLKVQLANQQKIVTENEQTLQKYGIETGQANDLYKAMLAKASADKANQAQMFQAVGTTLGAGVGMLGGGPAGAAVGATAGSAAGKQLAQGEPDYYSESGIPESGG
jgi:hypothetical protein